MRLRYAKDRIAVAKGLANERGWDSSYVYMPYSSLYQAVVQVMGSQLTVSRRL
jgi:hypothetical protein